MRYICTIGHTVGLPYPQFCTHGFAPMVDGKIRKERKVTLLLTADVDQVIRTTTVASMHEQTSFSCHQSLKIQHHNYSYNINTALGTIKSGDGLKYTGVWHRLQANTTSFQYIRDLSICGLWYPRGPWNHSSLDTEGYLYVHIKYYTLNCVIHVYIRTENSQNPQKL